MTYGAFSVKIRSLDYKRSRCMDNANNACKKAHLERPLRIDPDDEDPLLEELTNNINGLLDAAQADVAQQNEVIDWIITFDDAGNVAAVALARVDNDDNPDIIIEPLEPR